MPTRPPPDPAGPSTALQLLERSAAQELQPAPRAAAPGATRPRAAATVAARSHDWTQLKRWAAARGLVVELPLSPELVGSWLAACAAGWDGRPRAVATLERYRTSLVHAHRAAGLPDPCSAELVLDVMESARRERGTDQRQAHPLSVAQLRAICAQLGTGVHAARDRALLVVTFAGGFRASEVVGLCCRDLIYDDRGAIVTVTRSKTDQHGRGRRVRLPYGSDALTCPIRTLGTWQLVRGVEEPDPATPLFLSLRCDQVVPGQRIHRHTVDRLVKRGVTTLGLDAGLYSSHSLRSGLVTAARAAGHSAAVVMRQTGMRSLTTLERYDRDPDLTGPCAASGIGL